MKRFLILGAAFVTLCLFPGSSFAVSSLELTKNSTPLLNLNKNTKSSQLYKSGVLELSIESENGLELKNDGNILSFVVPFGIYSGTGSFSIYYKEKEIRFPVTISITKNITDFSIYTQLFQKNIQAQALSCESSAAADIIATLLGKPISESTIIALLPKSDFYNALPILENRKRYWGNPEQGFVGYIHNYQDIVAKQKLYTGYGVYEKPIAEVYQSYGLKTEILNKDMHSAEFTANYHLQYLLESLEDGKMVQLWGDWCTDFGEDDGTIESSEMTQQKATKGISGKNECYNVAENRTLTWYYKDAAGNDVLHTGLDGEHAFILLGWKGDKQNPTHIRVWDTNTGYHEYKAAEWIRKWELMDYRSIVVSRN